jgi:hypothetical protein
VTTPSFAFNTLTQPSSTVTSSVPSGFDAQMANLLANAVAAVVQTYALGGTTISSTLLGALPKLPNVASYQQVASFTASEALGIGASTSSEFTTVLLGVALQAVDGSNNPLFNVIALRGTQTYQEWINDLTAIPRSFALVSGAGSVHAGFYGLYTTGTDGTMPTSSAPRVSSSPAGQIYAAVTASSWASSAPLYVTGHSLGAALATLCAMDVASNASQSFSSLTMMNFAPPNVSAGILDQGKALQFDIMDPNTFVASYQAAVPNSFSVVNAADLVPILPLTLGSTASYQLVFLPVVPSANVVMYCAQLGGIAANHELSTNYLPYVQGLAGGYSEAARRR